MLFGGSRVVFHPESIEGDIGSICATLTPARTYERDFFRVG